MFSFKSIIEFNEVELIDFELLVFVRCITYINFSNKNLKFVTKILLENDNPLYLIFNVLSSHLRLKTLFINNAKKKE